MLNKNISILQAKEGVLISYFDTLAPVFSTYCTNEQAKEAIGKTIQLIEKTADVESLKRRILKANTAEHYLIKAYKNLKEIEYIKQATPFILNQIQEDLGTALQLIQEELTAQ
ncbi:MAG: hypothetical protein ACXVPE_16280 [Bacteroidia bacterium]